MLGFYLNSGDCGGGSVEASFECSDVEDTPEWKAISDMKVTWESVQTSLWRTDLESDS